MRAMVFATAVVAVSLPSLGADWVPLRKNDEASLSIDNQSIRRKGDEVSLSYLLDFARAQGDNKTGIYYRSLVTKARLRCAARTITLGTSELYSETGARGISLGSRDSSRDAAAFAPIDKGSSDEDLWKRVCEKK